LVSGGALKEGSALHKVLQGLEKTIYAHARQIVVVTKGWEDHFRELGINVDKVTVVPNGADLAEYEVKESREELRKEYGISGFTAVFSGTHANYVGLDLIVDAARRLPDVNFLLVGAGARKQWAIDEVAKLRLTNVTFHDQVPKSELVRILSACDVGLHTVSPQSVFDKGMSPNKLYDYMAAGLAVVSNAKVPIRDVISDDEVGACVDPTDLVAGIERVRDADEATMKRWHERARELMANKYSLQASVDKLARVLEKALYR